MQQTHNYQGTLTPIARLQLLDGWLRRELARLNRQRLQDARNPANPDLLAQLQVNLVRERCLVDVLNELNSPDEDVQDPMDEFPDPENDGSLESDSY